MSEPIRTSPTKRKQLAQALKANMARRKSVVRPEALIDSLSRTASVAKHTNQTSNEPSYPSFSCNNEGTGADKEMPHE